MAIIAILPGKAINPSLPLVHGRLEHAPKAIVMQRRSRKWWILTGGRYWDRTSGPSHPAGASPPGFCHKMWQSLPSKSSGHHRTAAEERTDSFAPVSRLELMPDGQDQHDVFGRKPAVLRDISVTAARED